MHIIDIGKAAAHAEVQLLQQKAMRIGRQVALLVIAAVLGFFALITGHALLWAIFRYEFGLGPVVSPALVFFLDFFFALVFAFFGRRSYVYPAELEAYLARDRRLNELKQTLTIVSVFAAIAGPLGRFVGQKARKR